MVRRALDSGAVGQFVDEVNVPGFVRIIMSVVEPLKRSTTLGDLFHVLRILMVYALIL
jgi:hypothetical protein